MEKLPHTSPSPLQKALLITNKKVVYLKFVGTREGGGWGRGEGGRRCDEGERRALPRTPLGINLRIFTTILVILLFSRTGLYLRSA